MEKCGVQVRDPFYDKLPQVKSTLTCFPTFSTPLLAPYTDLVAVHALSHFLNVPPHGSGPMLLAIETFSKAWQLLR